MMGRASASHDARLGPTDATLLIRGESGVGEERARSREGHRRGGRPLPRGRARPGAARRAGAVRVRSEGMIESDVGQNQHSLAPADVVGADDRKIAGIPRHHRLARSLRDRRNRMPYLSRKVAAAGLVTSVVGFPLLDAGGMTEIANVVELPQASGWM